MSTPRERVVEVLREHTNVGDYACGCGWEYGEDPQWPDIEAHQADMLAAAGLVPVAIEWSAVDPDNSAIRYIDDDAADVADFAEPDEDYPEGWRIEQRFVTPWTAAEDTDGEH